MRGAGLPTAASADRRVPPPVADCPAPRLACAGACSVETGTQYSNDDIAVIFNVPDAQSCCQARSTA